MPVVQILIIHDTSKVRSFKFGILVPVQSIIHSNALSEVGGEVGQQTDQPAISVGSTAYGVQLGIDAIYFSASEVDRLTVRS